MSDVEAGETESAAPVVEEKKTKAAKGGKGAPKKKAGAGAKSGSPSSHPKYSKMITEAIMSLKERTGSSRQAIVKYILSNYDVGKDERTVNSHVKMSLRASIKNGSLKQSKGVGASGSFRIGEKAKGEKKAAKKTSPNKESKSKTLSKVKKPKAAKTKKSAKAKAEKATPKKSTKKAKSPKKAAKATKAKSPKKSKSPKASKGKKSAKKAKTEEKPAESSDSAAPAVESS